MAGRVTQNFAEALVDGSGEAVRVTQAYIEVIITASNEAGRVTQNFAEALVDDSGEAVRVTQAYIEVIRSTTDLSLGAAGAPIIILIQQ